MKFQELENEIILENDEITVHLLPYGATLYKLFTKNRDGVKENIMLSCSNWEDLKKPSPYYGMTCGRHAGRIENGTFSIDGTTYNTSQNDGNHNLHGGFLGISHKVWDYKIEEDLNSISCTFKTFSPDMEEGFPGNVYISVTYKLTINSLYIEFNGTTDKKTFLNLMNHGYYNLTGDFNQKIYNHNLYICADEFVNTTDEDIPGKIQYVKNTPFDFREKREIGNLYDIDFPNIAKAEGYDHPFILSKKDDIDLRLEEPTSGRYMEIATTYPSLVIYTYNKKADTIVNDGIVSTPHIGIATECQYLPNAINRKDFEQPLIDSTTNYFETIRYTFGVK